MAFLRAKPIGVMQMIDQGEQDDKVTALSSFQSNKSGSPASPF